MKKKHFTEDELSRQNAAFKEELERMIPLTFDHLRRDGKRLATSIERSLEKLGAFKDEVFTKMLVSFYDVVLHLGPDLTAPKDWSPKAGKTRMDDKAFQRLVIISMLEVMFVFRLTHAEMDKMKSYAYDVDVYLFLFAFAETVLSQEKSREGSRDQLLKDYLGE